MLDIALDSIWWNRYLRSLSTQTNLMLSGITLLVLMTIFEGIFKYFRSGPHYLCSGTFGTAIRIG